MVAAPPPRNFSSAARSACALSAVLRCKSEATIPRVRSCNETECLLVMSRMLFAVKIAGVNADAAL